MKVRYFFFTLITGLISLAVIELGLSLALPQWMPEFEKWRQMNRDPNRFPTDFQRTIGQPYLLYVPRPGYKTPDGLTQHRSQGHRGPDVSVQKPKNIFRILCLGGSTTYGWGVIDPMESYPKQLETRLNKHGGIEGRTVEVINGGLPWGTSAEILTHYLMKWSYFEPDLVIINTGGNDAQAMLTPTERYVPDYSHWRQQMPPLRSYSTLGVMSLSLRSLSLIIYQLTEDTHQGRLVSFIYDDQKKAFPVNWLKLNSQDVDPDDLYDGVPLEYNAFVQNMTHLLQVLKSQGRRVALAPFVERPTSPAPKGYFHHVQKNAQILKELSQKFKAHWVPFSENLVESQDWADPYCHLTESGNKKKAQLFADQLLAWLNS